MGVRSFYLTQRSNGYYYAEFWCEKTTRILWRSTKTKNRDEAGAIVGRWQIEGVPVVRGKAKKPLPEVIEYTGVKKCLNEGDITEAQAMELVNVLKKRGLVKVGVIPSTKGEQIFTEFLSDFWNPEKSVYLRDKKAHGKKTTLRHCVEAERTIQKYYKPYFGDKLLCDVTRADIREFGLQLSEEHKLAAKTCNSKLQISTTPLKWAFHEKIIPDFISQGLGGFVGEEKKRDILTDEETIKLNDIKFWESKKAYVAYRLASSSGLRSGEVRAVMNNCIGEGILYIRNNFERLEGLKKPKNTEVRTVYLLQSVRTLLLELLAENPITDPGKQFVFFSDVNPEVPCTGEHFRRHLLKAIKNAKIDIAGRNINFHSLRHYCLTKWANSTGDLRQAAKVGGHKTLSQTAKYADHITEQEVIKMGEKAKDILPFNNEKIASENIIPFSSKEAV